MNNLLPKTGEYDNRHMITDGAKNTKQIDIKIGCVDLKATNSYSKGACLTSLHDNR